MHAKYKSLLKEYPRLVFLATSLRAENLPKIDCHLHTNWTDGEGTVREVFDVALNRGLDCILYSEHSRKTSEDWFPMFASEVRSIPSATCKAYCGTEVKVESLDGKIDTTDYIMSFCDLITVSVHRLLDDFGKPAPFSAFEARAAMEMERKMTLAALENPATNILGHVFGMSLKKYSIIPPGDYFLEVAERAASHGVVVEINSNYHNGLPYILDICKQANCLVSLGSNAHSLRDIGSAIRLA